MSIKDQKLGKSDFEKQQVPPSHTSIIDYRASLGHKVNHKFSGVHGEFCDLKHPVFGDIRGVCAIKNIEKGEEIYEDYDYDMSYDDTPRWYRAGYKNFYGQE